MKNDTVSATNESSATRGPIADLLCDTADVPRGIRTIDIREVAHRTGRAVSTIYKLIAAGKLRARKVGSRTVFLEHEIDAFLLALPIAGSASLPIFPRAKQTEAIPNRAPG
jgi:excisionase family DNA binding protein